MEIQNVELTGKHNYKMYKDVMRTYAMNFLKDIQFQRICFSSFLSVLLFIIFLHPFYNNIRFWE